MLRGGNEGREAGEGFFFGMATCWESGLGHDWNWAYLIFFLERLECQDEIANILN
jgi:hypothetical protein